LPLSFLKPFFPLLVNLKIQNNYSYTKQVDLVSSQNTVESTN